MISKACPVALHPDGAPRRIAVFEHPLAGLQLVKGSIKSDETPIHAAARELYEESGLETRSALSLGSSADIVDDQIWHFALCRIVPPVRNNWQHFCDDDGGHLFRFFWLSLDSTDQSLPAPYDKALTWIRDAL